MADTSNKTTMNTKQEEALSAPSDEKIYLFDNIEGRCMEEFDTIKEVETFVRDCYVQDGDVHPDIESLNIYKKVGGVYIEETGGTIVRHDDIVPVVKVSVQLDESTPQPTLTAPKGIEEIISLIDRWHDAGNIAVDLLFEVRRKLQNLLPSPAAETGEAVELDAEVILTGLKFSWDKISEMRKTYAGLGGIEHGIKRAYYFIKDQFKKSSI